MNGERFTQDNTVTCFLRDNDLRTFRTTLSCFEIKRGGLAFGERESGGGREGGRDRQTDKQTGRQAGRQAGNEQLTMAANKDNVFHELTPQESMKTVNLQ